MPWPGWYILMDPGTAWTAAERVTKTVAAAAVHLSP